MITFSVLCQQVLPQVQNVANTPGQEGWNVQWVCGDAEEDGFIEEGFEAWRLQAKSSPYVGRVTVTEKTLARRMLDFKARQLSTRQLHPVQLIRFMMLSGFYTLGPELASKGAFYT
jgi:hypothetical protein